MNVPYFTCADHDELAQLDGREALQILPVVEVAVLGDAELEERANTDEVPDAGRGMNQTATRPVRSAQATRVRHERCMDAVEYSFIRDTVERLCGTAKEFMEGRRLSIEWDGQDEA
jgi:hypothetical protein